MPKNGDHENNKQKVQATEERLVIEGDPRKALEKLLSESPLMYAVHYVPAGGDPHSPPVGTFDSPDDAKRAGEKRWRARLWGENLANGECMVIFELHGNGASTHLLTFDGGGWS